MKFLMIIFLFNSLLLIESRVNKIVPDPKNYPFSKNLFNLLSKLGNIG